MSGFREYQEAVILAYKKNKENGKLAEELLSAQRTSIRSLCLRKYSEGLIPDDEKFFNSFFNLRSNNQDLQTLIERADPERFKPLQNFLINKVIAPSRETINLLAILIDFPDRPMSNWQAKNPQIPDKEKTETSEDKSQFSFVKKPIMRSFSPLIGLAIIPIIGIWFIINHWKNKECMYWQEDRYIPCACADLPSGTPAITYDQQKVDHFRKILRTDTLNHMHIRQIWYSKVNNELEFFTGPGMHPVYTDRSLKIASKYILEKYILKNNPTNSSIQNEINSNSNNE